MPREQASEDPDGCLEDLWFRVHVKRNPVNDLADSVFKSWRVIQDHKGIQRVDESHREIASNIVCRYIGTARVVSWEVTMDEKPMRTGYANWALDQYRTGAQAMISSNGWLGARANMLPRPRERLRIAR